MKKTIKQKTAVAIMVISANYIPLHLCKIKISKIFTEET